MSEEELNLFLDAYYSIEEIKDEDELFNQGLIAPLIFIIMKYSSQFIMMTFIGIIIGVFAYEAWAEKAPTACAILCMFSFFFIWGASMAPDSEKYSDEYKKRKGLQPLCFLLIYSAHNFY